MKSKHLRKLAFLLIAASLAAGTAARAVEISEIPLCGSAPSIATNSAHLSGSTLIYQARFSSSDWGGQLLALPVQPDGSVGAFIWDAATLIPQPAHRNIYTYDPTAAASARGKPFTWSRLNSSQRTALNSNAGGIVDNKGPARLDYLRGDRGNEALNGEKFRARSTVLGDIVNSDPLFVGTPDSGFGVLPGVEGSSYSAFRRSTAYRSRPGMVYVGANDGMLHAFDATTGIERFAYVPNAAYKQLSLLTDPNYNRNHRYFVDGSARALDAYIGGAWQTVLVGALGAGGRGVFVVRVTDPVNFGASDVLWDFTNSEDPDLGLSLPQPSIARMNNGKWAAIFANGYNSTSQRAVLFVMDLATGAIMKKIDTGAGGDNGLSSPLPVDVNGDRITDFLYAGDLKGNLWKFDVRSNSAGAWDVAFKQGSTSKPMFSACATAGLSCSPGNQQAITARPEAGLNPKGGLTVYFGTGRYLATADTSVVTPVNSFYGIFDQDSPAVDRGQLLPQEVRESRTLAGDGFSEVVRITSSNQLSDVHRGWYIDLPEGGERQVSTPALRGGRIIFTTLTPSADCASGGSSWLMELNALSGAALSFSPFDINRDRQFNIEDFAIHMVDGRQAQLPASGRRSKQGIIKTPAVITSDGIEFKFAGGATGGVDTTIENSAGAGGRKSWRQLR